MEIFLFIALLSSCILFFIELYLDFRQLLQYGSFSGDSCHANVTKWLVIDFPKTKVQNQWAMKRIVFDRLELILEFLVEVIILISYGLVSIWDFSGQLLRAADMDESG